MGKLASKIIELAQSWIGKKESDGSHKEIVDIYNGHTPRARGYKVKYTDSWCATFISALAIKLGYTDIIPTECSCQKMIELFKKIGCWIENENRTPNKGDVIFYDWQDNGKGDNTGWSDHVGIVEKVSNGVITIIEGNKNDGVERREIAVNGKTIRGYGVPKYDTEPAPVPKPTPAPTPTVAKPVTQNTSKKSDKVLDFQNAAICDGFTFPKYGTDGEWGAECEGVASKAVVKKRVENKKAVYKHRNLTKIVQRTVGVKVDGKCGDKTHEAIEIYQRNNGLTVDGCVGLNTWKKILGV